MKILTHGSLFSGIGGFDLAAQWMGWENVFHCEWNEFGQKILKYYWPNAISYTDITKTDFSIHRGSIDILTGGFPCQPYSAAGKRLGTEDDRHLWPQMLRAIREIQPVYVVGENVRGLTNWNGGLVFDQVQADLEAEGYEVLPFLLPACAVNAPHRRDRIWFVAYNSNAGTQRMRLGGKNKIHESKLTSNTGLLGQEISQFKTAGVEQCNKNISTDTDYAGLQRSRNFGINTSQRKEQFNKQFNRSLRTGWQIFPTQPPLCSRNDGFSTRLDGITFSKWRNESIKGFGNAIVPQIAFELFKVINRLQ